MAEVKINKSQEVRNLYKQNMSVADIARKLKIRYQYAWNVVNRMKDKSTDPKYSVTVMEANRGILGVDENDISQDTLISTLSKNKVFENWCKYNGYLGSNHLTIKRVLSEIYGVKFKE